MTEGNAERRFYLSMTLLVGAGVVYGFTKTVFLRSLHPEVHAPPEPYFYYLHGLIMFAWVALFVVQVGLVAARKTTIHRRLGLAAVAVVPLVGVSSVYGAIMAYRRPGGLIDIPVETQLPFMALIISVILMYAIYAGLALALRRHPQAHKRLMLLASIILMEAAVIRWPFEVIVARGLAVSGWVGAGFMAPLVAWDLWSRRRIHPATLWGIGAYLVYLLTRDALFAGGPFLSLVGSLAGAPGH